jgi:hypothetical protein
MKTPNNANAPELAKQAPYSKASPGKNSPPPKTDEFLTGKPTLHGQAPSGMERYFAPAAPGNVPEFCKLPAPRERCPFTGASRSWLIDQAEAGNLKLVRVRRPGKLRGAVFVHVPSLLEFLRRNMEEGNTNGAS